MVFAAKTRGRDKKNLRPVYVVAIGMSDGRTPLAIRNCLGLEGVVLLKRSEGLREEKVEVWLDFEIYIRNRLDQIVLADLQSPEFTTYSLHSINS